MALPRGDMYMARALCRAAHILLLLRALSALRGTLLCLVVLPLLRLLRRLRSLLCFQKRVGNGRI